MAVKQFKSQLKALRNEILLELLNAAHGHDQIFPKNVTWISIFVPSVNSKSKHRSPQEENTSTNDWSSWLTKQLTMQEVDIRLLSDPPPLPAHNVEEDEDESNTVVTLPPSFSHAVDPVESTMVKTGNSNIFINTKENSKSLSSLTPLSNDAKVGK